MVNPGFWADDGVSWMNMTDWVRPWRYRCFRPRRLQRPRSIRAGILR